MAKDRARQPSPNGLRARKKAEMRRHISNVATGLFAMRGFEAVTVAEVAQAANVSKMTVFNYFPRKEDLLLDRHAGALEDAQRVVAERPEGTSIARAFREHAQALVRARHPLSGVAAGGKFFGGLVAKSPALRTRVLEMARESEDSMAEAIGRDVAGDPEDAQARMVAALLTVSIATAFRIATQKILAGALPETVAREQAALLDTAFDLLENGIGDYGRTRAARPKKKRSRG